MTQRTILDAIDDPELSGRLVDRRDALARSGRLAAILAVGSVPVALAAVARSAFGQGIPQSVAEVLNFALTLEYLESEFYTRGLAAGTLIPSADRAVFQQIAKHEAAHVAFLQGTLGPAAIAKPTFDLTARGAFGDVLLSYTTFKALAQAFEDTGVRAYKGQARRLINDKPVLSAALSIHSVEARHAAQVRKLRGLKGWISTNSRNDLPAFTQGIYNGEENVTQGAATITSLPNAAANGGLDAATEAFDEPLTKEQVLMIVDPFIVGDVDGDGGEG